MVAIWNNAPLNLKALDGARLELSKLKYETSDSRYEVAYPSFGDDFFFFDSFSSSSTTTTLTKVIF